MGAQRQTAGHLGVPVVLVTGDDRLADEVRTRLPGAEMVVVKQALSRYAALSLPQEEATAAIRRGAARGLARASSVAPFTPSLPIRLEVDFGRPEWDDETATLPRAERLRALSVGYTAADGPAAWRAFYSFMALAAYAS